MNRLKLNKIVSYMETQNEFPFDVWDVKEDFWKVLDYFCIYVVLNAEEQEVIQTDLQKLAEIAQTAEMARVAAKELALPEASVKGRYIRPSPVIGFTEWLKVFPEEMQRCFFASLGSG